MIEFGFAEECRLLIGQNLGMSAYNGPQNQGYNLNGWCLCFTLNLNLNFWQGLSNKSCNGNVFLFGRNKFMLIDDKNLFPACNLRLAFHPSKINKNIFSSKTTWPNGTNIWQNFPWKILFQNCVWYPCCPTWLVVITEIK